MLKNSFNRFASEVCRINWYRLDKIGVALSSSGSIPKGGGLISVVSATKILIAALAGNSVSESAVTVARVGALPIVKVELSPLKIKPNKLDSISCLREALVFLMANPDDSLEEIRFSKDSTFASIKFKNVDAVYFGHYNSEGVTTITTIPGALFNKIANEVNKREVGPWFVTK